MPTLGDVPGEIIGHILSFVPPEENLKKVQLLSQRYYALANQSLLWRNYCIRALRYWHPSHDIYAKLATEAKSVDWKALWIRRKRSNVRAAELLDGVLTTKVGQSRRLQQICLMGYDVKDFLLDQCHTDDSADDVLARRYYANTALDSIHRGIAVEEWSKLPSNAFTGNLAALLGAFDMFVLHDQPYDISWISDEFKAIADDFQQEHPMFPDWTPRRKALALVKWLRAQRIIGTSVSEQDWSGSLRHCLIGHVLTGPDHSSLSTISCAIYCSVAAHLGILAVCCPFPRHLHVSVLAPSGTTLDGTDSKSDADGTLERMFLDPFDSSEEVSVSMLRSYLVELGWHHSGDAFLGASPLSVLVVRMARSIQQTYSEISRRADSTDIEEARRAADMKRLRAGHDDLNLEALGYAAMWALLLMQPTDEAWDDILGVFLNRFALAWSEDAWIVDKYLVPLYDAFVASQPVARPRTGWENVRAILDMLKNVDRREAQPNWRYTEAIRDRVRYKIGQVFRHRRYGFIGIINGWAASGADGLPTPHYLHPNDFDESSKVLYTCLRPTVDRLRIAQENVEVVTDASLIDDALLFVAGKFFKRFDRDTCTFVSNIKEMFPDD